MGHLRGAWLYFVARKLLLSAKKVSCTDYNMIIPIKKLSNVIKWPFMVLLKKICDFSPHRCGLTQKEQVYNRCVCAMKRELPAWGIVYSFTA